MSNPQPYALTRCCKCAAPGRAPVNYWPSGGDPGFEESNPMVVVCDECSLGEAAKAADRFRQLALLERIAVALERLAGGFPGPEKPAGWKLGES
jgi:hypothetical protein